MTQEFIEAVKGGKLLRVRIMLKDSLLVDPTTSQFNEMERYAIDEMGDIYVQHNGEKLDNDISSWNEDYLSRQMVIVVNNFSHERIDLLKSMVQYLYKDKVEKIHVERPENQTQQSVSRKQIGTGVTVAGAALAIAGLCTSQTVLTVGGVVIAVAGVALIVSD